MKPSTRIGDLMTTQVITVSPDDTIVRVREKMMENTIHHIPVVSDNKVVGIVSKTDIHKVEHHFTLFDSPEAAQSNAQIFNTLLAKEIMSSGVVTVHENEPAENAVDMFLDNMFHALPVVNDRNELTGMLTTFDIIRHCFKNS